MASNHAVAGLPPETLSASGRSSEKLSLPSLQSKMKSDPEGYESELILLYRQFKSSLELFQQQAALNFTSISGVGADPAVAKDLGDRAMFLAHVTPFYPNHLSEFPNQLAELLRGSARTLLSGLRCHVTQALILLINRKIVDIGETLALFMELQTVGDRTLKKLAFSHVVHSVKRMNQKHKNETKNRALQNILFAMLQQEDEAKAKRSLITLCELHRRKVWFDERTANAICTACFHPSSRIMIAALLFLLDYEKIEDDDDSDASSSEDDLVSQTPRAVLSKEAVYKAHHTGTVASKKKKKAKLQRAMRSMKRQQRLSSEKSSTNFYSPLNHLKDAQGFSEKLFSRLQTCNERFEVKMMMLKVVARTVGLHRLILLNFYPFLQKYVQPHQRDITNLLAAAVQACHDMVPPDAVEPLFRQIVNQFVHDRSRTEAIAVGLNVVREICLRIPLLMTEDLLQDLVLYKKSHEKAVSTAARSLVTLFREVCPSLLIKKDRGRPTDPKARPKAYGEMHVVSDVPGVELLQHDDDDDDNEGGDGTDESTFGSSDNEKVAATNEEENQIYSDDAGSEKDEIEDEEVPEGEDGNNSIDTDGDDVSDADDDDEEEEEEEGEGADEVDLEHEEANGLQKTSDKDSPNYRTREKESKASKRKLSDFVGQLIIFPLTSRLVTIFPELKFDLVSISLENHCLCVREKMATNLSSTVFAISVSSPKARNCKPSLLFNSQNPLRCKSISSRRFLSRKLCQVQATVLRDNAEKLVVEESFQPKNFPNDEGKGDHREASEGSSSSVLEKWIINFEQSVNIFLTDSVIKILDTLYHDRDYARFFVLETIARVPYFAFISVLHMYESFGWWRRADYLKVHFAESWNEMHHLLIMEELGGNAWWFDRLLAQHVAFIYYFMTVFMYTISPRMAYHLSECVEKHAYETYDKFIKVQGEKLKELPAPEIAVKYYTGDDLYLFDEFQTARVPQSRRPKIENLYDVFVNVRDDEAEHCKTMKACQKHGNLCSPHSFPEEAFEEESGCILPQTDCEGIVDCIKKSVTSL